MRTTTQKSKNIKVSIILLILFISILIGITYEFISNKFEIKLFPRKYSEYVEKYCAEFGVPETVVYAVIKTESDFDKNAVSSSDPPALGLMQLTESTYEWMASKLNEKPSSFDIYNPEINIKYGVYLLSFLYRRYDNWDTTYAAYNAGLGRVDSWLENPDYSDGKGNLTNIPFKETSNYVKRVNEYREKYEKLYYSN